MKSVLVLLGLFILLHSSSLAQSADAKHGVSYKILWIDHHSPDKNWINGEFEDTELYTIGAELTYSRWLSKACNLAIPVKLGVVDINKDSAFSGNDKAWFSTDALLHLKIFDKPRLINPYLMGGIGVSWLDFDQLNPQIPVGMGLNIRLASNFFLNTQVEYRTALDNGLDNFHYGAGLNLHIGGSKPKVLDSDGDGIPDLEDDCPFEAGLPAYNGCPDSDGDGIPDKDDACPNEAGPASTMGCPDTDGDGIADNNDACPNEPGPASTMGCPDTDGDGIHDKDDRCPQVAGPANLKGCPDRDNDGIADIDDKCPDQPGPISNQGCPELKEAEKAIIKLAIQNVSFTSSTAELTIASKSILDQLADVLRNNPAYSCDISGHTDATGGAELNMELSKKRAKSCYDYLVLQGIDEKRLTHQGYGLTSPVGDNKTAEGRRANRRVEFDLRVK